MLKWTHPNALLRLRAAVQLINGKLGSYLHNAYEADGISSLEGNVLAAVKAAVTPMTVPQIARMWGNSRQAIQGATIRLRELGLIRTAPNPNHKRSPLLHITDEGRAVVRRAEDWADSVLQPLLDHLDADRTGIMARELLALLARIEAIELEDGPTSHVKIPLV